MDTWETHAICNQGIAEVKQKQCSQRGRIWFLHLLQTNTIREICSELLNGFQWYVCGSPLPDHNASPKQDRQQNQISRERLDFFQSRSIVIPSQTLSPRRIVCGAEANYEEKIVDVKHSSIMIEQFPYIRKEFIENNSFLVVMYNCYVNSFM